MWIVTLISALMVLSGIGTSIATHFSGPDVFEFLVPTMSANMIKMLLSPINGFLYLILSTIQKNQVGLIWYGSLILIFSLLFMFVGIKSLASSKLAAITNLFFHAFLFSSLTGFIYHFFCDYSPMTVADVSTFYSEKLVLWPWNVASAMENVFIQHRVLLLIAAAVSLVFYLVLQFTFVFTEEPVSDIPYILSYVIPVVFTLIAGKLILKNCFGIAHPLQAIKDHPFFAAGESRLDLDYFRVLSVYLLCGLASFGMMRAWIGYSEVYTGSTILTMVIAACSMMVMLAAAVGIVLMFCDALALLFSSIVSTLIAIVGGFLLYVFALTAADFEERKIKRIVRRERMGMPVTEQEATFAATLMDVDDPDYLRMAFKTNFATQEQVDAYPSYVDSDDD